MPKLLGSLLVPGIENNQIFNLKGPYNRDDCLVPYLKLRELFEQYNIELNTADVNLGKQVDFELHLNVQTSRHPQCYLLQMETEQILPGNFAVKNTSRYQKIFTWHDSLVNDRQYIKINFPNAIVCANTPSFDERRNFACLVSANKAVSRHSPNELYSERVRTIRWFQENAPLEFHLYGIGWEQPARQAGAWGLLQFQFHKRFSWLKSGQPFPSYRGKVESKASVLRDTKFCICYENVKNEPGYITEKIFDSFFSGCVPVYWGAPNIADYVPTSCYIDRRNYPDHSDLYRHLKSITSNEYAQYQKNILEFLRSDQAYPFGADYFSRTIVQHVIQDFGQP